MGLATLMSSPPPEPGPKSNMCSPVAGISTGTITAIAVAAPPTRLAVLRTVVAPAPNEMGSPVSRSSPSGRPQRATWSLSWRKSIVR